MLNKQIISSEITPLQLHQTVEEAISHMESQEQHQMPVVSEGHFQGLVMEEDLLDAAPDETLASLNTEFLPFSVNSEDHFLTAARLSVSRHLHLVPVVTPEKEYFGAITTNELMNQLTRLTGLMDSGALIVMEMDPAQFSISEIARLVETNDAHILQLNTAPNEINGQLQVTIRLNRLQVSDIVATFQRYDYQVVYYAGEEQFENELRRNYQHLMNFLEM
jgi:acetoin utilization protein AcuB